jgi:hypothetical protein
MLTMARAAPILDRAHGKVNPLRATRHRRH